MEQKALQESRSLLSGTTSKTNATSSYDNAIQQVDHKLEELDVLDAILKAEEDPYFFLTTFCYTLDQHDHDHPIKLFPSLDYIRFFAYEFINEKKLLVEKSRQMIVTWTFVALCLWDTMFHKGKLTFFQSKKEEDANALVDRAKFIYRHLPKLIQDKYPTKQPFTYMKLTFPFQESEIRATPQGPEQIRMHTSSNIFSDEMAFQEEARNAYAAAKPTIDGGGRFIGVSTANGKNFFYRLSHDLEGVYNPEK